MTTTTALAPARTPLPLGPVGRAARVAVLTGSYGGGHDAAAHQLAAAFSAAGCEVEVLDVVDLLPLRLGLVLRTAYYAQLRHGPSTWRTTLRLLGPGRRLSGPVTRALGAVGATVAAAVAGHDLVVTTHPFGAQALGRARAAGRLACPVVTYLTDPSVHSLWLHPGVDLNLAIHEVAAEEVRPRGFPVEVVVPLVPAPAARSGTRDPLASYDVRGRRALVTGGSLGIGELEQTCRDIVATRVMTPVVLCGSDRRLQRRLARVAGVVALGWRDDVPALMAHSDCVVQNAGGFTSLEALRSGAPTITYRPVPGHGEASSRNLERAGLVPWARTPSELAGLLAASIGAPRVDRVPRGAPDVVSVLLGTPEPALAA